MEEIVYKSKVNVTGCEICNDELYKAYCPICGEILKLINVDGETNNDDLIHKCKIKKEE